MKKRFVSAALAAVMALSMTACGSSNSAAETMFLLKKTR